MVLTCICEAREQVKSHVSAGQTEGAEDRNFADSIRKARGQVESHVVAGHANSEDVLGNGGGHFRNTETPSRVGFGERMVPDVHLTRFAAYFVALQVRPEGSRGTAGTRRGNGRDAPGERRGHAGGTAGTRPRHE